MPVVRIHTGEDGMAYIDRSDKGAVIEQAAYIYAYRRERYPNERTKIITSDESMSDAIKARGKQISGVWKSMVGNDEDLEFSRNSENVQGEIAIESKTEQQ